MNASLPDFALVIRRTVPEPQRAGQEYCCDRQARQHLNGKQAIQNVCQCHCMVESFSQGNTKSDFAVPVMNFCGQDRRAIE